MNILITGGTGFLGQRLAHALLKNKLFTSIVLADIAPLRDAALLAEPRVKVLSGDLTCLLAGGVMRGVDGVYHLAAAVSGECEADIDVQGNSVAGVVEKIRVRSHRRIKVLGTSKEKLGS